MRGWFACLLGLLLAGCAAAPVAPLRPPTAEIREFAFVGRLAARQGEAHHHVHVDWRHQAQTDTILLTTPLGHGIAELTRDASGARLVLADGRRFAAADWSTLAREVFGFDLPLDSAERWLLEGTVPDAGWRVTVVEREGTLPGALPKLIELEHEDIFVRLKIDDWVEAQ